MKIVAVIEFNGEWTDESIHEVSGLVFQHELELGQEVTVSVLTEKGSEKVREIIYAKTEVN